VLFLLLQYYELLLPLLHIKLRKMKQFVKALPKTGNCFKYLCKTFPHLSEAKLKQGVLVGPDIRKLMFDEDFLLTMTEFETDAWIAFEMLLPNSWGTTRILTMLLLLQIC
jgi:hypothetical protein